MTKTNPWHANLSYVAKLRAKWQHRVSRENLAKNLNEISLFRWIPFFKYGKILADFYFMNFLKTSFLQIWLTKKKNF
jgi:hypothetical protein